MSGRTFSIERRAIPRDWFDHEGDEGGSWVVSVDPLARKIEDGRTAISMGFPVLVVTDMVQGGEDLAKALAEFLTEHTAREG